MQGDIFTVFVANAIISVALLRLTSLLVAFLCYIFAAPVLSLDAAMQEFYLRQRHLENELILSEWLMESYIPISEPF